MFLSRSAQDGFTVAEAGLFMGTGKGVRLFVGPKKLLQQRELGAYVCSGFIARLPRGSVRRRNAFRQAKTLQLAPPLIGCGQHIPREQCELFNEERTPGKMQRQNMGYLL